MKLENNFTIDAPVEKAWEALNSPETVAPCFPGATLTDYEGDSFSGTVKVKLGPIAMTYKGKGTYVSRDEAAHEVVIDANGRDSRGNGTAKATVTASLAADGAERTAVSMVTDMTITGKPAQFGRGVIADVADKIIGRFAACVARKLTSEPDAATPASEAPAPATSVAAASTNGVAASPAGDPATGGTSEAEAPASTTVGAGAAVSGAAGSGASEVDAPASTSMVPDPGAGDSGGTAAASSTAAPSVPATPTGTPAAVRAPEAEAGTSAAAAPPSTSMTPEPATAAEDPGAATSEAEAPASTAMGPGATAPSTPSSTPVRRPSPTPRAPVKSEVDAIDLLDTAGAPVLKRLAPVAGGAVLVLLVVLLVRWLRGR